MKRQGFKVKKACFLSKLVLLVFIFSIYSIGSIKAESVHVVSAENVYGDIAKQIGGDKVQVDSILNNPDQDPHLFELTPRLGKVIYRADWVIVNGLGYDSWINRLLSSFPEKNIISVQKLMNRQNGDNPHLWYDVKSVKVLAEILEKKYSIVQPYNQSFFYENFLHFSQDMSKISQRIQKIRSVYSGIAVAATEPVFGWMSRDLGFSMLEEPYQWVIMNEGEPTLQQIAQFVQDIKNHKVRILFYNNQVSNPATEQLKRIAQSSHVPVVGVEETMPVSLSYQQWMNQILDRVEIALQSKA